MIHPEKLRKCALTFVRSIFIIPFLVICHSCSEKNVAPVDPVNSPDFNINTAFTFAVEAEDNSGFNIYAYDMVSQTGGFLFDGKKFEYRYPNYFWVGTTAYYSEGNVLFSIDAITSEQKQLYEASSKIEVARISPDQTFALVTGEDAFNVEVINLETSESLLTLETSVFWTGWSSDSRYLSVSPQNPKGVIEIYDMETLSVVRSFDWPQVFHVWRPEKSEIALVDKMEERLVIYDFEGDEFKAETLSMTGAQFTGSTVSFATSGDYFYHTYYQRAEPSELQVVNMSLNNRHRIVGNEFASANKAWNKNENKLLYHIDGELFIYDAATRETVSIEYTGVQFETWQISNLHWF